MAANDENDTLGGKGLSLDNLSSGALTVGKGLIRKFIGGSASATAAKPVIETEIKPISGSNVATSAVRDLTYRLPLLHRNALDSVRLPRMIFDDFGAFSALDRKFRSATNLDDVSDGSDDSGNFDPEKFHNKNYRDRNFWVLAAQTNGSDSELSVYNGLSAVNKVAYKIYLFTQRLEQIGVEPSDHGYAHSYSSAYQTPPGEYDYRNRENFITRKALQIIIEGPPRCKEHFSFVLMSALIHYQKQGVDFTENPFYETASLVSSIPDLAQLKSYYADLKSHIRNPEHVWEQECVSLFTESRLLNWVDAQMKALDHQINGKPKAERKPEPIEEKAQSPQPARASQSAKNNQPDDLPSLDVLMQRKLDIVDHSDATPEQAQEQLDSLIGLEDVKKHVHGYATRVLYDRVREKVTGLRPEQDFRNMIFYGPPGVGKTTVAKYLGAVLSAHGILPTKQSIVIPASDIIGAFVGQTEVLLRQLFNQGRGGLIAIDEFDILAKSNGSSFDMRAIDTLNGLVDKEKEHGTIFVLTGYKAEVNALLEKNPGLARRFPHRVMFEHYSSVELDEIFTAVCERRGYTIDEDIMVEFRRGIMDAQGRLGDKFGNASIVETIVGLMENSHSLRFDGEFLQSVLNGGEIDDALKRKFRSFDVHDVPSFDIAEGVFKLSGLGQPLTPGARTFDAAADAPKVR